MQEDESYGHELLERIETTIALLGMSHQQRRADLEFENFEYKGSNIGKTKGVLYICRVYSLYNLVLFIIYCDSDECGMP